jgi:hypothetical protein
MLLCANGKPCGPASFLEYDDSLALRRGICQQGLGSEIPA